jgi:hypothetical protein
MAGSGTTGDVIEAVPYFADRQIRMYDHDPVDERIKRANVLQTGIPEQTGSVDYVFLDPPHEYYPRGTDPDFSPAATRSDSLMKLKTLLREGARVVKPGGRLSIIVEVTSGSFGIIDFPFEVCQVANELGMLQIGKVYLSRRAETPKPRPHTQGDKIRTLVSECRELLTFEKPTA